MQLKRHHKIFISVGLLLAMAGMIALMILQS